MSIVLAAVFISADNSDAQDYGRRDTDFVFTLVKRTEFPSGIDVHIRTTRLYPCTGYLLQTGVSRTSDTLTISLGGLLRPSPCVPMSAEATASFYLGNISDGSYILRIRYRSDEDIHRMIVTGGIPIVRSGPTPFTTFSPE